MKRFVQVLILCLGLTHAQATPPTPEQVLGFPVGADRKLPDWKQLQEYFRQLDAASDRVKVERIGESTLGQPLIVAMISSPANLRRLSDYMHIQALLADPRRKTTPVVELVKKGRSIVLVTCGIHSAEVASPLTAVALADELANAKDSETEEILDNVIVLLVPSLNPDGTNRVAEWYRQTLGTPAEGTLPPELYHPYAGHDNNRDWFMFTQKETRAVVEKIHNRWHPQVVVDLHQMGRYGARIFTPPYLDPIDPNVDPVLQGEIAEIGASVFAGLLRSGKSGVVTNAIFDAFTPARAYQHYHGGVRVLIEAASADLATPVTVTSNQLLGGRGYDASRSSWNYPLPWTSGSWRLADIIDYQRLAVRYSLLHAARYRQEWLEGFYTVGTAAVNRQDPFAYIVPADQRDPLSLQDLVEILRLGQVEVDEATRSFTAKVSLASAPYGTPSRSEFPKGSLIVRMQQPYSGFAKTLLEIQHYLMPPGSDSTPPYDVTAQTLGMQLGVSVYQADAPFLFASVSAPKDIGQSYRSIRGQGNYCLFSHENNAFAVLANRFLSSGSRLSWAPNGFQAEGGQGFPAGTFMARYAASDADLKRMVGDLPVAITRVRTSPELAWQEIRRPRIGLYCSYSPTTDEGWTRWILEHYEFAFTTLHNEDILKKDLAGFDAIIIPSEDPKTIIDGLSDPYPQPYLGRNRTGGCESAC